MTATTSRLVTRPTEIPLARYSRSSASRKFQMKFNVFEQITKPWPRVTLHNVHLLAAHPTGDSFTMITVEHQGAQCDLISANRWDAEWSPRDVGRCGYLVPAEPIDSEPQWACRFRTYLDPSLRRLYELDVKDQWGWLCDDRPQGFLAPAGLLPGVKGRYVADETISVTLRIPPEFGMRVVKPS